MTDFITTRRFHADPDTQDWRVVSDGASAFFRTASLAESARLVAAVADLPAIDDQAPSIDVRPRGVTVSLLTKDAEGYGLTEREISRARQISTLARELGLVPDPAEVQSLLVIVEGQDRPGIMPFWAAVLGYERRADSPEEDLVDPRERGASFWFEDLEEVGPEGKRIHLAVWVGPDHAAARVEAALAAGGHVVRDQFAPSWWTLADADGHEIDVATTANRD